jgi:hypothetical protein
MTPRIQLTSRGSLYAPVKYTRSMCKNTAATMNWAAQLWIDRSMKPNWTSLRINTTESYAAVGSPCAAAPAVDGE